MSLGVFVLILLTLAILGAIPVWPHSRFWGYAPSSGAGLAVLILIVLLLSGKI